jgi:hypothetical protein
VCTVGAKSEGRRAEEPVDGCHVCATLFPSLVLAQFFLVEPRNEDAKLQTVAKTPAEPIATTALVHGGWKGRSCCHIFGLLPMAAVKLPKLGFYLRSLFKPGPAVSSSIRNEAFQGGLHVTARIILVSYQPIEQPDGNP